MLRIQIEVATTVQIAIQNLLNSTLTCVLQNDGPKGCFKVNSEVEVAAHDDTVNKLVYNDDLLIEAALHQALKKGQENGEIDAAKDTLALARFFTNTVTGMRVYAKFRTDRQFLKIF